MEKRSLAYAHYWRNSLADTDLSSGGFFKSDLKRISFDKVYWDEQGIGFVSQAICAKYFDDEPEHVKTVKVIFRPKVYLARTEHGKALLDGVPQVLTPLVTPAVLARDGRLYPSSDTIMPRDLLEPLQLGSYAIGRLYDLDTFLSTDAVPIVNCTVDENEDVDPSAFEMQWEAHLKGCERLMTRVCSSWPTEEDAVELADFGFLLKKTTDAGFSKNILGLYDHICKHTPSAPLFDCYAHDKVTPLEPCLSSVSTFVTRLGHSNNAYPLAEAQRDSLTHVLASQPGEILAVNGPPGTGKTTLLLSVVATLWAKAALEEEEPPVILAASTNNQAVTNIIDAFGKDFATGDGPFANRWLPGIKSFGAYFPSKSKEKTLSDKYQTHTFFDNIESFAYIAEAKAYYLAAAANAFSTVDTSSIEKIVEALHQRIKVEVRKLKNIKTAWNQLIEARIYTQSELGNDPQSAQEKREQGVETQKQEKVEWEILQDKWEEYRKNESIWYALFAWISPVAKKRLLLARGFLKNIWPGGIKEKKWMNLEQIESEIKKNISLCTEAIRRRGELAERGKQVLQEEEKRFSEWMTSLTPLGNIDNITSLTFSEADQLADKKIRFQIFRLTTHYWEGRWLLEMEELLPTLDKEKKKNGRIATEKRWRRRMKLTPCVVSTFFMLPSDMVVSKKVGEDWVENYLYDFADLLIVDEAGQVLPEVAGASFALAKKALVIGDTLQIEPIWSIPVQVDVGNLASAGLYHDAENNDADFERMVETGKTASSGSVMQIAQCASRWHYDPDLARGMFLYEHRRCFDEIIGYCNTLCYHGKLIPMRGTKSVTDRESDGLPAIGYLHVDGICQQRDGGSRKNLLEAETIAAWLAAKKEELEDIYGKPLHEIVGVVTPFAGQVQAIMHACRKEGIAVGSQTGQMTVGTVHSLQGAERPVVIFSTVYSKHPDGNGLFIDRSPSMLNVAVSRAKNSFLVFGDMDVLGQAQKISPRGQLAACLFADDANALQFEYRPRRDLASQTGLLQLRDAKEHDAFLMDTLSRADREIHIVTPWIRPGCMKETGIIEAMASAVSRGVKVYVYSDYGSNTLDVDPERRKNKQQNFRNAIETLRAKNINSIVVSKVHSKIVIGDENIYCVGSFNWFSAQRDETKQRHETSLVYRGTNLVKEIGAMKESLKLRAIS